MLTTFMEFEFPELGLVPVHVVNDRLALGRFRHSLHDQFISLWVAGLAVAQLNDGSTVQVQCLSKRDSSTDVDQAHPGHQNCQLA